MMLSYWKSTNKRTSSHIPSVQSPIEKSDPNPPQQQEENHEWERKSKPGAKIDDITVWKVTTQQEGQRNINPVIIVSIQKDGKLPF